MRRAAVVGVTALAIAAPFILGAFGDASDGTYRVDAIFDSARGMVPGQLVKIAGVRVGRIAAVRLAPGPSAALELEVPRRFAPFRQDASCRILPEGFISEYYVDCDPGRSAQALADGGSGRPTVGRSRTSVPVTLQDVIDLYAAPTNQRLRIAINELGLATAGRGTDINAMLRRANPALAQADRVLTTLRAQNGRLGDAVGQTDAIVASIAAVRGDLRRFVDRTAKVAVTAAERREALSAAVAELPRMLRTADRSLRELDGVVTGGQPVLDELRAAGPQLTALTTTLPAFARAGRPAVRELGRAAATGRAILRPARSTTAALERFARLSARPIGRFRDLLTSLRDTGGNEALMNLGYTLAAMSSGYDSTSHMAAVYIGFAQDCMSAAGRSAKPPPGCSHAFTAPGDGTVPVNAPSAGPQNDHDTVLSDGTLTGAAPPSKPSRAIDRRSLRALLDYLLG